LWKNFGLNKIREKVKVTYKVEGLNQNRLIENLRKRDITLFNVKKINNKLMYMSVNLNQSKNFFAITKELCYNIKKVRYFGKGLPLYSLLKNAGLIIGALIFIAVAIVSNDYVLSIDFSGSGSVCQKEVRQYLSEQGVTEKSRFSSFSLERLEDGILSSNKNLTFASVTKKGNSLKVYLVLKTEPPKTLGGNVLTLESTVSGKVESIKVYRGRALVGVGDMVSVGDLLVDGQVEFKEQIVSVNVLACVTIRTEEKFTYRFEDENSESLAVLYATESLGDKEPTSVSVEKTKIDSDGKTVYEYSVTVQYLCVLYAG